MKITEIQVANCRRKLLLLFFLNLSDYFCTTTIIQYKGFEEINPIMIYLLEKPMFCFMIKCVLPLLLVGYIFYAIKNASDNLIFIVNIVMLIVVVFYSLINIMHIINFIVLFNMY